MQVKELLLNTKNENGEYTEYKDIIIKDRYSVHYNKYEVWGVFESLRHRTPLYYVATEDNETYIRCVTEAWQTEALSKLTLANWQEAFKRIKDTKYHAVCGHCEGKYTCRKDSFCSDVAF